MTPTQSNQFNWMSVIIVISLVVDQTKYDKNRPFGSSIIPLSLSLPAKFEVIHF